MKAKLSLKSFHVLGCTFLICITYLFISPILAQKINRETEEIIIEVKEAMHRAERFSLPLFAPTNFAAANEAFHRALEEVEKGENPERIFEYCEQTLKLLDAAFERARISQDALRPLIIIREETIDLVKNRLVPWRADPDFFKGRLLSESDFREEQSYNLPKAESMFGEAVLRAEVGDLDGARAFAREAELEYRNSAIEILKNDNLHEARAKLREVESDISAESFRIANSELDKLERFLYSQESKKFSIGELSNEIRFGIPHVFDLAGIETLFRGYTDQIIEVTPEDLIALREVATKSLTNERITELLLAAEEDYRKAIVRTEGRNRITDQQAALAAESAYREAILISLREGQLKEGRILLEESRGSVTPEEYRKRARNFENAEGLFEQVRNPGTSTKDFLGHIKKIENWIFLFPIPPSSLPDLTVELWSVPESQKKYAHLKWLSPYPPVTEQLTTVLAVVKNIGIGGVNHKFDTELYVDGNLVKTWTFSPYLKAENMQDPLSRGETLIREYTGKFAAGKHNFHWKVDTKNEVAESDESESSNELKASYVWKTSSNLPDLIVEDIYHEGDLLVGNVTTWKIKIKNSGKTDVTTPFMTSLKSDGVQFGIFWLDTLKAGESKTFETKQSTSIIGSQYTYKDTITGTVDVSNVVPEANENNNVKVEKFTISYVDLAVTSLVIIPTQPLVHEPVTFSFDIKNNGPADASNHFKIRVMPGKVSSKGTTEPIFLTFPMDKLPLKVGNTINLKHKVTLAYAGNYQAGVIADYSDPKGVFKKVYLEKYSANNTKTFNFHLKQTYYVKVAKIEYTNCNDGVIVHLDRSGGFWKGEVKLQLMSGSKVISFAKPYNKNEVIVASNQNKSEEIAPSTYFRGYDLKLKVYALEAGKSIPSTAPEKTIKFPQNEQIVINSVSPGSGAKGSKVLVTVHGKALVSSYTPSPPSVSAKSKKCTECPDYDGISIKVKNYTYDQIAAELDIKANASTGKKWIHVWAPCNGAAAIPFNITASKPQVPTTKEYTLYLKKQAGPPKGGAHPFSGSILPIPNAVLQTITNVNTALGARVGVRIIKTGYTTDDCDKSKAVVDLAPGKSTSDFKGASLSNGLAIAACIYIVQANAVPNQVALKITYTK